MALAESRNLPGRRRPLEDGDSKAEANSTTTMAKHKKLPQGVLLNLAAQMLR